MTEGMTILGEWDCIYGRKDAFIDLNIELSHLLKG
jgi:hypothetical protein